MTVIDQASVLDELKQNIPDFAKDIRINLGRVLTEQQSKGLTITQIQGIALASAFATASTPVIQDIQDLTSPDLDENEQQGIRAAVSIMAMNNVYYRSMGMLSDPVFSQLSPGLRMQVIGKPGIEKVNFELYSLAVSAINGCHHCVDSHAKVLLGAGVSHEGIQSAIRLAAIIQALAQVYVLK